MDRREIERLTDLIETLGAPVFGQQRGELFVDTEEVVQRLLKFIAIQPTEDRCLVRAIGGRQSRGEDLGEAGFFASLGAWLLLRRHLALVHAIEDVDPFGKRLGPVQIRG